MPLRYFFAPLLVMLMASAAVFASPTDSTIRARVQLNDSLAAEQFATQLPRSLLFDDRMGTGQVAYLSEPLEAAAHEPVDDHRAGDVVYWASGQSIVVFLTDGADVPADDLALIGHVAVGLQYLAGCNRNCPVLLENSRGRPVGAIER